MNTLEWARAGMSGWPHAKGLPSSLRTDQSMASYSDGFNYSSEYLALKDRRWDGVVRGTKQWNDVIDELVAMDFTLTPTFAVYEAFRDFIGVSRADWIAPYAHPALLRSFGDRDPDSVFSQWGTTEEINWKRDFSIWMAFVNDFKNRGGRVTAGGDTSYYWTLPGFGLIRNMELLQEAGFTPLEVIRAATLYSAEWLRIADGTGSVEIGKRADIIITERNPLHNLKVLYGTGVPGKGDDGSLQQVGGIRYAIKRGVIYNPATILSNVRKLVTDAKDLAN
jgi:hypothetical protein